MRMPPVCGPEAFPARATLTEFWVYDIVKFIAFILDQPEHVKMHLQVSGLNSGWTLDQLNSLVIPFNNLQHWTVHAGCRMSSPKSICTLFEAIQVLHPKWNKEPLEKWLAKASLSLSRFVFLSGLFLFFLSVWSIYISVCLYVWFSLSLSLSVFLSSLFLSSSPFSVWSLFLYLFPLSHLSLSSSLTQDVLKKKIIKCQNKHLLV